MRPHQLNNHTIALTKPPLLTVLTNYGSSVPAIGIYVSPQQTSYKPLLPVIDILTGQVFSTDPRGGLTIPILASEPRVFLPLTVHQGIASKEAWAAVIKVDEEVKQVQSSSPGSPGLRHGKRPSFSSVISWLGVGRDSKPGL